MLTNAQIKFIKSLHTKRSRQENGLFIAEGDKICRELLNSNFVIKNLFALQQWIKNNEDLLSNYTSVVGITQKELSRISLQKTPNQVLAVVEIPKTDISSIELNNKITIVLETIQDAGNLGTIIRTADWFGINNIVCSTDCVELYNPKVVQSSMGSITRTNVVYTKLEDFFKIVPGNIPVIGAFMDGAAINTVDKHQECILVFGNESNGISNNIKKHISIKTTIPSFNARKDTYTAESLNVAVAAAVYMSWLRISV